jgi:hypothetical protein
MRIVLGSEYTLSRYVYFDAQGVIVNVIIGDFTLEEEALFFAQHRDSFGAAGFVQVGTDVRPIIGGSYDATSGEFSPPPSPEPEPLVVDGTSEVIVEETTNDDAPIE